jgi:hypothetical protein
MDAYPCHSAENRLGAGAGTRIATLLENDLEELITVRTRRRLSPRRPVASVRRLMPSKGAVVDVPSQTAPPALIPPCKSISMVIANTTASGLPRAFEAPIPPGRPHRRRKIPGALTALPPRRDRPLQRFPGRQRPVPCPGHDLLHLPMTKPVTSVASCSSSQGLVAPTTRCTNTSWSGGLLVFRLAGRSPRPSSA